MLCTQLGRIRRRRRQIAGYISLITDVFLRLIKMIIAPLVFSTLVVGIAHMGDAAAVGRIGVKAMAWFVSASLVSLLLGLVMVNILRPGDDLNLPLPDAGASTNLKAASLSLKEFVTHLVPEARRRGDGQQRDPADRRVLGVLRRRRRGARREGQAARRRASTSSRTSC